MAGLPLCLLEDGLGKPLRPYSRTLSNEQSVLAEHHNIIPQSAWDGAEGTRGLLPLILGQWPVGDHVSALWLM